MKTKCLITAALVSAAIFLGMYAAEAQNHPWKGAKVAYLGDSITDPTNLPGNTKYWGFLEEWLDITPFVYGISGHQWFHIFGQTEKLQNERGDDFDAIMIFMGTNDYNSGVPIGEWFSEEKVTVNANGRMVERTKRTPVFGWDTFRGRINIVMDMLKKKFPEKQIVLLTPIHRAYAWFADHNVQPAEDICNACGEYLDAYVESVKEASAIWSIPVIDIYSLSGLFPMHEEQKMYFPGGTDWLHPNEAGHRRLAHCIMQQLSVIPCRF